MHYLVYSAHVLALGIQTSSNIGLALDLLASSCVSQKNRNRSHFPPRMFVGQQECRLPMHKVPTNVLFSDNYGVL